MNKLQDNFQHLIPWPVVTVALSEEQHGIPQIQHSGFNVFRIVHSSTGQPRQQGCYGAVNRCKQEPRWSQQYSHRKNIDRSQQLQKNYQSSKIQWYQQWVNGCDQEGLK